MSRRIKNDTGGMSPEERLLRVVFGLAPGGPPCHSEVNGITLRQAIEEVLVSLKPRDSSVIRMRFGFGDPEGTPQTMKATGAAFGVSSARIAQIEVRSLRRLRHPSRSRRLKAYLGDENADRRD